MMPRRRVSRLPPTHRQLGDNSVAAALVTPSITRAPTPGRVHGLRAIARAAAVQVEPVVRPNELVRPVAIASAQLLGQC